MFITGLIHWLMGHVAAGIPVWLLLLVFYFGCRMAILSLCLWVMLRAQDLNYTVPGILLSAALASVFDIIPFIGHTIAVAVLLICIMKLTHSDFIDVRFTVAIAYALTFLTQMLVLSAVPTQIHARDHDTPPRPGHTFALPAEEAGEEDTPVTNAPKVTPVVATPKPPEPAPKPAPVEVEDPGVHAALANVILKGVMQNGTNSTAIIETGGRTFWLTYTEPVRIDGQQGPIHIRLKEVKEEAAVVLVNGHQEILPLRTSGTSVPK